MKNIKINNEILKKNLLGKEQKIFLFILSNFGKNLTFEISLKDLAEKLSFRNKNDISEIKKICLRLNKKNVDLDFEKGFFIASFFKKIKLNNNKLIFILNEEIKQTLYEIKENYSIINPQDLGKLKGKYSLGFYNFIKINGFKGKIRITVEEFKQKIGFNKEGYNYSLFKTNVIKKCINDLKEIGYFIKFYEIKNRKRVVFLEFHIDEEKKEKIDKNIFTENQIVLIEKLVLNGIKEEVAKEILLDDTINNSIINKNIDYVNKLEKQNYYFKVGKTNFLVASIRENYNGKSRIKKNHFKTIQKEIENKREKMEKKKIEIKKKLDKQFLEYWEKIPLKEQNTMLLDNRVYDGQSPYKNTRDIRLMRLKKLYFNNEL